MKNKKAQEGVYFVFIGIVVLGFIVGLAYGLPKYNIYRREMSGKAQLKEAE